jgi:hypothetical protein
MQLNMYWTQCFIPQRTTNELTISISINGGASFHEIAQKLVRVEYAGNEVTVIYFFWTTYCLPASSEPPQLT